MAIKHFFAGVPVADYGSALAWYVRLFGRAPDFHPNDTEAVWKVGDAGWIYVVTDTERAGKALLTLLVDDLEDQVAELAKRGLTTGAIDTMPEVMRKAEIADPEGNRITFGEDLSPDA
jgi:predicted enzyme related to lactoylglutathione lyase